MTFAKWTFAILLLGAAQSQAALPHSLYRAGNSTSPRLDNVRPQDAVTFFKNGATWVKGKSGKGISSFDRAQNVKNEWCVAKGTTISSNLHVHNDQGNHWSWEPAHDMPLSTYTQELQNAQQHFKHVSRNGKCP
jgi:hypothetical protein